MHCDAFDIRSVSCILKGAVSVKVLKVSAVSFFAVFFTASTPPVRRWPLCCFGCTQSFGCEGTRDDHHEC